MNEIETFFIIFSILFFAIGIPIYCSCITNNKSEEINLIKPNK